LESFNTANKKRADLLNKAYKLGWADGALGDKVHYDDIFKWPEIQEFLKAGANIQLLMSQLAEHYNDGFDIKTGQKTGLEDGSARRTDSDEDSPSSSRFSSRPAIATWAPFEKQRDQKCADTCSDATLY
jgi:hypothetical protein